MKISIIIVNYKSEGRIVDCLHSIFKSKPSILLEVIVVDNSQSKSLKKIINKSFSKVKYISSKNHGFGVGNNIGAILAKGEYLFFLNPDTKIFIKSIENLVNFLNKHKNVGVVAPLLLGEDYNPYQQGTMILTPKRAIFALSFLNKLFPGNRVSKKYWLANWNRRSRKEVEVVPGTAFVIRKTIFEKIGGFDKNFFLYFEEFDLCKKVKELGYKLYIIPDAKVVHFHKESTKHRSDIDEIFKKSRFYYFKKHYGLLWAYLVQIFLDFTKLTLITLCFFVLCFLILLYFHTRGVVLNDEGYILNSASRMIHGEIAYKDFDFVYTPGTMYLAAIAFKLFGESILAGKMIALIVGLSTSIILYRLVRCITKKSLYGYLAVLFFLSWGPSHINFIWPVMPSMLSAFLWCYFAVLALSHKMRRYYFLMGVSTGLGIMFKQNFGAVMLFCLGLFLLLNRNLIKKFLFPYFTGMILCLLPTFLYLLVSGSFFDFVYNIYLHTIKRIIIGKDIDSAFLYGGTLFWYLYRAVIYLFPLYISIGFGYLLLLRNKKLLFIPLLIILFYITGIRPTTDYGHITPLIALSALPFILSIFFVSNKHLKRILLSLFVLAIVFGFYTSLYKEYYRYNPLLVEYSIYSTNPKIKVFLDKKNVDTFNAINYEIARIGKNEEFIFVNEYYPLFYFITGLKNPTRHDVISISSFYDSERSDIQNSIEKNKVKLIITPTQLSNFKVFIEARYKKIKSVGDFIIWERKN